MSVHLSILLWELRIDPWCKDYILLGRLAQNLESSSEIEKSRYRLVGISPRHVATLFVWSDVITLLVQVAGGLMKIADNVAKLGHYIGLLGIALQLLSYIVFILLLRRLHTSCNDLETTHLGRNVRILVNVIWASSFWIVVSNASATLQGEMTLFC